MVAPRPVSEFFLSGDRLVAEVAAHATRFGSAGSDLYSVALDSDVSAIASSYGALEVASQGHSESLLSCSEPGSIQRLRQNFQQVAADKKLLKSFYCDHPSYPDALLAYLLCYVLPEVNTKHDSDSRVARVLLTACRLIFQQWPGRPDLLTAFMHKAGSLAMQKHFPNRSLGPQSFYGQTAPSLAYLQELWIKGRYQEIMIHYAAFQCCARAFPSSDYMLRVFTILGLLERCQSLFRCIYARVADQLMPSSLSNMLFTELGMEYLDQAFVETIVREWRVSASASLGASNEQHRYSSSGHVRSKSLFIDEKPVLAVLSADLRNHPVGRFWLPIARKLQHRFRLIHIDFSPSHDDHIRGALRACSSEWWPYADEAGLSLSNRLNQLQPSILLDLGGHTADNRPALLNRRFASVQATYLGFYGPTYASECDWWILDRFIAARVARSYPGSEPIWQLPCPSLCYLPELHRLPDIDQLHYDNSATAAIGSFNHTRKISTASIGRIASILHGNPAVLFKFRAHSFYDTAVRQYFLQHFLDQGVSPSQLLAIPYAADPSQAMLDYCRLHLHIDSFPVSGTTTTMDALAMGIPVLTSPNELYAGAISAALLESIGLDSMVCNCPTQLSERAHQLIKCYREPDQRRKLAVQVRQSSLCDPEITPIAFTDALASMLRLASQ